MKKDIQNANKIIYVTSIHSNQNLIQKTIKDLLGTISFKLCTINLLGTISFKLCTINFNWSGIVSDQLHRPNIDTTDDRVLCRSYL